ncbi:hypothetical protein [Actinotignum sanguinis]|uniref:hypothetical protein n=1 Tax=Actinotignum sanguinis TaxID=1445614 RepID=UPI00237DFE0D|nr:hypothetical protein [Actinotignum sanguinis]MDE1641793.1 hypothetical protein [Actinotignum sanguinis]
MSALLDHEIVRGAYLSMDGQLMLQEPSAEIHLDPLPAGDTWQIKIDPYIVPPAGARVGVQGAVHPFTSPRAQTFTLDPLLPVVVRFEGWRAYARFKITIITDSDALGPGRAVLMAYLPRRDYVSAILGKAILGSFTLPDPERVKPWFILGISRVGYGTLSAAPERSAWYEIQGAATSITTTRGVTYTGVSGQAMLGTLEARIINSLDPRASGLIKGTPLRLIDRATRAAIFTGRLEKTISTPEPRGGYTLTLTAHDAVAITGAKTKWQETRAKPVTWQAGFRQLLEQLHLPAGYKITGAATRPKLGDMVKESPYTTWLDIFAATCGVTWYVDARGVLRVIDAPPATLRGEIVFTKPETGLPAITPTSAAAQIDTSTIFTGITATNNAAERGEDGRFQGTTTTLRTDSATLAGAYGTNTAQIETCAASIPELSEHLRGLMRSYQPEQALTAVEATPWNDDMNHRDNAALSRLLALEILDALTANYRGTRAVTHITGIRHEITPKRWHTALTLKEWRSA